MKRVRWLVRGKIVFITMHRRHVYYACFVVALFVAYVVLAPLTRPPAETVTADDKSTVIVAIDAGHGGPDPGAVGVAGTLEKDITLAIALQLRETLRGAGLRTVMTRTEDKDLVAQRSVSHRQRADLIARAQLVNKSGAELFVSLHANSFPSPSLSGAQTFHLENDDDGWRLANHIQTALVQQFPPNRRRAAPADLRILHDVQVPAAVVEVGFLSNPEEESLLNDPEYQRRIARAVADGILAFVNEERRRRQSSFTVREIPYNY